MSFLSLSEHYSLLSAIQEARSLDAATKERSGRISLTTLINYCNENDISIQSDSVDLLSMYTVVQWDCDKKTFTKYVEKEVIGVYDDVNSVPPLASKYVITQDFRGHKATLSFDRKKFQKDFLAVAMKNINKQIELSAIKYKKMEEHGYPNMGDPVISPEFPKEIRDAEFDGGVSDLAYDYCKKPKTIHKFKQWRCECQLIDKQGKLLKTVTLTAG